MLPESERRSDDHQRQLSGWEKAARQRQSLRAVQNASACQFRCEYRRGALYEGVMRAHFDKLAPMKWALVILVIAVLFCIWIDASAACKGMPEQWLPGNKCSVILKFGYDWQNLLAGLSAIFAAWIGASAIARQMRQADEQEEDRLRRKHASARALLPLALSGLSEYAQECADRLTVLHYSAQTSLAAGVKAFRAPEIPSTAVAGLQAMVEAASILEVPAFSIILSLLQIQAARLRSVRVGSNPNNVGITTVANVEQYMIDTADIVARTRVCT